MNVADLIFIGVALLTVGSALVVVLSRDLIYSVFSLLFTFFGVAMLYVLLGADFLAATQVMIYVGGILILLLFGVMLTQKLYNLNLKTEVIQFIPGVLISAGAFATLAWVGWMTPWPQVANRVLLPTTAAIGSQFLRDYLLPFEIASVLLLIALIGAAMLVRRRTDL
jgi:NADH:ubiquinone oxidoreductase subunit 6 (subunit J)